MSTPTAGHMCLVVVGATGMIGGYALRCAPNHPSVIAEALSDQHNYLRALYLER